MLSFLSIRSKLAAAGLHFLISAVVVTAALLAATLLWYPSGFRLAAGLTGLAAIMLLVDLVLGPALTFLVYEAGKKSLRFDLTVIAAVQVAALLYGSFSIYQARPAFVAFVVDRFELVSAADLEEETLAQAAAPFDHVPSGGPVWVRVEMPLDPDELDRLTMAEAMSGTGPALLPVLYRPFERIPDQALGTTRGLDTLERFNDPARVRSQIESLGAAAARARFVPLRGIGRDMTVFVDSGDGSVLGIADLRPWG